MSTFERLSEFYEEGNVPWDQPDPPPEVMEFVPTLPAGRALDLGCGLGRASIFMARHSWQVDAIDFIEKAIVEARSRAEQAGVADKINFHHSPVSQLDYLEGPYDFALDVGCAHNFALDELKAYHDELMRLLRPGASYLIFAHLEDNDPDPEPEKHWLKESDLRAVFEVGFTIDKIERGQTQVRDNPPWPSAWVWFRRV